MVLVFQVIDFNCVLTHSFHSVSVLGGCTDGRKCIYDSYTLTGFLISNHFFFAQSANQTCLYNIAYG